MSLVNICLSYAQKYFGVYPVLIYLKWLLRDTSFQQDSAPAHGARDTIEFLRRVTPDFIGPELWPANSPDLNPVDYRICGLMEERVYQSPIQDVHDLKQRLISVWTEFKQSVIDKAIDQWRPRLRSCVCASGQHFEQLINCSNYLSVEWFCFYKYTFSCELWI